MNNLKSAVFDYKAIGDIYREKLGGPPFPIEQDAPLLPNVPCTYGCGAQYNPNTKSWSTGCNSSCQGC